MSIEEPIVCKVKPSRHRASSLLRRQMLEKYGYSCAVCGIKNDVVPLQYSHIVPLFLGGESSEDNLIILCPNCNESSRRPREFEFVSFLAELLEKHPSFSNIRKDAILGRETRYRADILVDRIEPGKKTDLLIECKTSLAHGQAHVEGIVAQLTRYKAACGDCRLVLAVPATLTKEDLLLLRVANIEVWDLPYIASHFSAQIGQANPSYYSALVLSYNLRSAKQVSREEELLDSLASCNPGRADCYIYQALAGEILEWLFTPPLGKPIAERSDSAKANRRDFIMPNYTDSGFWSFLRQQYEADYIVIDAKNYARKVKKSDVLQIANYLKSHGAGLFGIIMSRKGGDAAGCDHTLREQWLVHRKLILILDDEDLRAMLLAKSDGRPAEDILGQKIEYFRLSM